MRRFASVFVASRRSDKSDAPSPTPSVGLVHKKSRVFPSLSRKHLPQPETDPSLHSLVASDLANSSSSSSSGSTTIRTPDDDGLPRTPSRKASWKSWLGGRNTVAGDPEEHPPWQSSQNMPRLPLPGFGDTIVASTFNDTPPLTPSRSPQQMAAAHANARTMIMNSLVHQPTSSPLFSSPDTISFPRSCHDSRRRSRPETLESELHKKSLLARLDRLSPSEESSIAHLASKPFSPKLQTQRAFRDDIFPSVGSVSPHSSGLENWVTRPCFEDRVRVWTLSDSGEVISTRIPGSRFGVAALEFSEALELLASTLPENDEDVGADVAFNPASEFTLPSLPSNLDPPATQLKEFKLEPLSLPSGLSQSTDSPTEPSLSPQPSAVSHALSNAPSPSRRPSESTVSESAATNDSVAKRGVRFADDDGKDDQIPLGYVLRIRKNKEQKARFLREERERRRRAAQLPVVSRQPAAPPQEGQVPRAVTPRRTPSRPLVSLNEPSKPQQTAAISHVVLEEERLRREVEKIEMDKLRRSRELAKKQAEERERAYVEELQATRARREASRAGRPLESASPALRVSDRDRSASRDSMHASLRRTSASHKHTPELVFTPVSPYDGSPSSSVPATPGSQYSLSRPPSIYSTHTASSEDIRGRDGRHVGRRMSVVSDSAKSPSLYPPYDLRASFNPYAWMNVPPVPAIPPVPPMPIIPMVNGIPFHGMDMPLLPPTPPFMMHEFGARTRSYTGSGQHHSLQGSTLPSRNDEGVNSGSRNSSPRSSGSHQRRSSDDAARMAKTLGQPRSGSYNDVRASVSVRGITSLSSSQRSSWLPPEQSPTNKPSTLRPANGSYTSGAPTYLRRRTLAS